jgi:hypothetical protein
MTAIAAKNAGVYYLFFLNEIMFCVWFVICSLFNIKSFVVDSTIQFVIALLIMTIYFIKMYYDHKRVFISLRDNITIVERITAHKNPVFLRPNNTFYNPYDRGFSKNLIEFFMPCILFCFLPKGEYARAGEIIREEFPDGIKNSVLLKPKHKTQEQNKKTEGSYEEIVRDSTLGTAHEGDYDNDDEERKIGDEQTDRDSDKRYDIDAIIENSILPKYDPSKLYNWYHSRFYSVIDIVGHPMHNAAKIALSRHLQRLQAIEMQQARQNVNQGDSSSEGSGAEDAGFDHQQLRQRDGATASGHMHPGHHDHHGHSMQVHNQHAGMTSATTGPFSYGNQQLTEEQVLKNFNEVIKMKSYEFEAMAER